MISRRNRWGMGLLALAGSVLSVSAANALTLSAPMNLSSLGEPLRFYCEIRDADAKEMSALRKPGFFRFANADAYNELSMRRPTALAGAQLQVEQVADGGWVLVARGVVPVKEPLITTLVSYSLGPHEAVQELVAAVSIPQPKAPTHLMATPTEEASSQPPSPDLSQAEAMPDKTAPTTSDSAQTESAQLPPVQASAAGSESVSAPPAKIALPKTEPETKPEAPAATQTPPVAAAMEPQASPPAAEEAEGKVQPQQAPAVAALEPPPAPTVKSAAEQSAAKAAPVVEPAGHTAVVEPPPVATVEPLATLDAPQIVSATQPIGGVYGPTIEGEELAAIALKVILDANLTQSQAMVGIWLANPWAFVDDNINKLMAGQKLTIPSTAALAKLDDALAWRVRYQHKLLLRGQILEEAPLTREALRQVTIGRISAADLLAPASARLAAPGVAPSPQDATAAQTILLERIDALEHRLARLEAPTDWRDDAPKMFGAGLAGAGLAVVPMLMWGLWRRRKEEDLWGDAAYYADHALREFEKHAENTPTKS
ncbi:FimV/HubP family polar landmark protein [Magnetofaba australis]|uniref:Putative translation initiation factor n=1 Tax=Magnetofaba australis IT-1 TaxID=1434232 RepID=A0A1Y2K5P3_9PROT|nr:FimV/HubP family polar landmark protein [Magnetofaba australis]OSM05004.1 putative translation initiation factor [Magnetofaba australis IT-1]